MPRGNKTLRFLDKIIGVPLLWGFSHLDSFKSPSLRIKKILVVNIAVIGDTILFIPALRALRKSFPEAHITVICSSENKELLETCPYIDDLIVFSIDVLKNPLRFFKFFQSLRNKHFDVAIDFGQWIRLAPLVAYLAGVRIRVGFKTKGQNRHFLFTNFVDHINDRHEVDCYFDLLKILGVNSDQRHLELWVYRSEFETIDKLLKNNGLDDAFLIGFHPGTAREGKRWDIEKFAELGDILIENYKAKIVLTGSSSERSLAEQISALMKNQPVILTGKTSLRELVCLIARLSLFITGNTGPMHIAASTGTPTIVLSGPVALSKWGPYGGVYAIVGADLPCSPCVYLGFEYGCNGYNCMRAITVDNVLNILEKQLENLQSVPRPNRLIFR